MVSHIIVQVTEVEKPLLGLGGLKTELSRTIVGLYVKILGFLAAARRFFDGNAGVRWIKGIFQRLKSTVTDFINGVSSIISDVYQLSNEVRWEGMARSSVLKHSRY